MKTSRRQPLRRNRPGVESLEGRALLANAGAIDPSFGDRGTVSLPFSPNAGFPDTNGVDEPSAIDANGKILLSGTVQGASFDIERLNSDGSVDTTFGTKGLATIPVAPAGSSGSIVSALIPQADGTILAVGTFFPVNSNVGTVEVIRVTSSGTLDTSYGTNGVVTLPATIGTSLKVEGAAGAALDASGQLVVGGYGVDSSNPSSADFFATRLEADGSVDTTFGTAGYASVSIPAVQVGGYATGGASGLVIQPGGRILLAGEVVYQAGLDGASPVPLDEGVVVGLTAGGSVDTTFGPSSDGIVVLPPNLADPSAAGDRVIAGAAVQADGSIVLAGTSYPGASSTMLTSGYLLRLTAAGAIDSGFGQGGSVATGSLLPDGVTIEAGGQILVPGSVGLNKLVAARYDADGSVDTTFGQVATPGLASYPTNPTTGNSTTNNAAFTNALVDSAGNIILTGYTTDVASRFGDINSNFAVVRAFATITITPAVSQPPADLAGTNTTDYAVYLPASSAFAYLPASGTGGKIVHFGIPGAGQTIPAVGDYTGSGHAEVGAYLTSAGVYAIQQTATSDGLLVQFGMAGAGNSIPVPADYYGTGVDDVAVYMPTLGAFAIMATGNQAGRIIPFGTAGAGQSIPAPADYYGTGQDDVAVYLEAQGAFAVLAPGGTSGEVVPFGKPGLGQSIPVPGDYDGSGHTEFAVYIPSLGAFFYRPYNGGADVEVPFGTPGVGELPVVGDYDGSGHDEFAVYDPTRGFFAYRPANGGNDVIEYFGTAGAGGSIPVATPAGALPGFAGFGSGGGGNAKVESLALGSGSGASASSSVVVVTTSLAVPKGPSLAATRVALSLVNLVGDDPLKFTP